MLVVRTVLASLGRVRDIPSAQTSVAAVAVRVLIGRFGVAGSSGRLAGPRLHTIECHENQAWGNHEHDGSLAWFQRASAVPVGGDEVGA